MLYKISCVVHTIPFWNIVIDIVFYCTTYKNLTISKSKLMDIQLEINKHTINPITSKNHKSGVMVLFAASLETLRRCYKLWSYGNHIAIADKFLGPPNNWLQLVSFSETVPLLWREANDKKGVRILILLGMSNFLLDPYEQS